MKNKTEFEKYSNWGKIFSEIYDKLFSLMIHLSQKRKKFAINLYFHSEKALNIELPFNKITVKDRFPKIREALLLVFAEINTFLPILQDEYKIAKLENKLPFTKPQIPDMRIDGPTNLITLKDTEGLLALSAKKKTAASRIAAR